MAMRTLRAVLLAAVLIGTLAASAFAQSEPIAGCPDGFHLHQVGEQHDGEDHFHIGTSADQNGDGWICAMHVSVDGSNHVHIDNRARSG